MLKEGGGGEVGRPGGEFTSNYYERRKEDVGGDVKGRQEGAREKET